MARKSTGSIVEKQTRRGLSYGIRFRALGTRQYVHVGYADDGVGRPDAERELVYALEQVRRGDWRAPAAAAAPERTVPTFHEAATDWLGAKRIDGGHRGLGLSTSAEASLCWQLEVHLLPTFAHRRLDEIGVEDVDRWRRAKGREGRIAPGSINKCLRTLAAILETAVEYGLISSNPANGRRRRLPVGTPHRTSLARASHIEALLTAASELDLEGRAAPYRRPLLATLVFAGLRIDECLRLRWHDVDLGRGVLQVRGTKTAAAARGVQILPALRDELGSWAAAAGDRRDDALVFGTRTGAKHSPSNVRRRVLAPAVARANERLAANSKSELPRGLTPHSLRRTFASLLYALGEPPPFVMAQMGHRDPGLALAIYAKEMERRDGEPQRLRELVEGSDWAPTGTSKPIVESGAPEAIGA